MVYRVYDIKTETASGRNTPPARPAQAYHVSEPPYEGYHAVEQSAYRNSGSPAAIVIDNGTPQSPASQIFVYD
jgi:actin-related protein 5